MSTLLNSAAITDKITINSLVKKLNLKRWFILFLHEVNQRDEEGLQDLGSIARGTVKLTKIIWA